MIIGIIGGGQLGMMMAEEANILGHKIISLDPNSNCSITHYSDEHISKEYDDRASLQYMYDKCDVLTYEFENVDLNILQQYIDKLPQGTKALEISRDRLIEKGFANDLKIRTPKYHKVNKLLDITIPSIIKTTTGGYDGKGQYKIAKKEDIDHVELSGNYEYICEELINFDYEISVIATRDTDGDIAYYPIPRNTHLNGILHTSVIDSSIPVGIQVQAKDYTKIILEELDYVGTLAVEYFVVNETVLFNEFAPRPHNSGHYTMDGCSVSQFKNHIFAITKNSVEKPILYKNSCMLNVLGQNHNYYRNTADTIEFKIHDYYKNSDKLNRKIGHINFTYKDEQDLTKKIETILKES